MDGTTKWIGALIVGLALGCDKPPPPPPAVTEDETTEETETTSAPESDRPTMAELMSGPWTTVQLGIHPLRVRVPEKWDVQLTGNATVLRGPAPGGDVDISITRPPPFPKEMAKKFQQDELAAATQPSTTAPATTAPAIDSATARDIGPNRVLDIRTWMPTTKTVDWRVIVFAPTGGDMVNTYQLRFFGIPLDQYQDDKELLEKIVNSLEVDPAAGSISEPTRPRIDPFK